MTAHFPLSRIEQARAEIAVLLDKNPAYEPIFLRLEAEAAAAEAALNADPVERARQRIAARRAAAEAGQ